MATYDFTLDAEEFKKQRLLVLEMAVKDTANADLWDGLMGLLDAIGDQAHDNSGLDVLLTE